jgi:hypothetical protein
MSNKIRSGQIGTNTSNFDKILSGSDDDVQKALNTIDNHIHDETRGGTGQTTYNTGDILYADGYNSLTKLPIGLNGEILKSNGSTPEWGNLDVYDAIDVIRVGKIDILTPNTTSYLLPDFSESNNEDFIAYIIDGYGTLSNLYIYSNTAPGLGEDVVITVRINGADTVLTETLSNTDNVAINDIYSINVEPGDLVTVSSVTSASCAAADLQVSVRYGELLVGSDTIDYITVGKIGLITPGSTRYLLSNYAQSTNELFPAYVATQDGYVDDLRIYANTPCGIGESTIITLRDDGVDTLLTTTISNNDNTANDLVNQIFVNSGSLLTVRAVTSAGCAISDVFISMRFSS